MNTPISTFYDYFPGSALTPGIPPILGAGKLIEFEDDFQYMKQLYPEMCKKLLNQIEECCDHLEYEGSSCLILTRIRSHWSGWQKKFWKTLSRRMKRILSKHFFP